MNQVKISMQEVIDINNKFSMLNNNIYDNLMKAKTKMDEINGIWQSRGSETIVQKFNQLSNKFILHKEVLESYIKFVNDAVNTYDTLENTIVFNANSLNE